MRTVIYPGSFDPLTNGHLDVVEARNIGRYEQELYRFLSEEHADLMKAFQDAGEMTDEIQPKIDEALKTFTERFLETL